MQSRVHALQGDITTIAVGVIVSAANFSLLGGDKVDGAIHRAAGPVLSGACKQVTRQQGECPTGHAAITLAGALPTRAVIRAVGPVWQDDDHHEAERPEGAYLSTLQLALTDGYQSIAFPAISTGAYGYPRTTAAEIAAKTVLEFTTRHTLPSQIYFVCFDEGNARLYKRLLTQQDDEHTNWYDVTWAYHHAATRKPPGRMQRSDVG